MLRALKVEKLKKLFLIQLFEPLHHFQHDTLSAYLSCVQKV